MKEKKEFCFYKEEKPFTPWGSTKHIVGWTEEGVEVGGQVGRQEVGD